MDDRKKINCCFFTLAIAALSAGCGVNQPTRFQNSFLPAAPRAGAAAAVTLPPPPEVKPKISVRDVPAFLLSHPQLPDRKTKGDAQMMKAAERFQQGKRLYQVNDAAGARKEFDAAIDLMIEAAEDPPADRQDYDRRLEQMTEAIHRYDLAGLGAAAPLNEGKFEQAPLENILQMTFPVDPKLKDRVRDQVAATVSQLPLAVNDSVLGYINYFSNRGHSTVVAGMRRSGRYRPMIQRILDEEGVPQELIHLAQAESGFIPRAISRKAAGGMWQFVVFRGNQYGLMQSPTTDERMDPEKATRAAARHLRDLYTEFGDWYLAIAAYNCGPGTVEKAVERTGYADFWELRRRGVLPAETTNYVPIILAMTIMEKNAAEYGLTDVTFDTPLVYDTVELAAPTSLALVADITETPASEIAALNPAVLRSVAPGGFALHVPKGTGTTLLSALECIPAEHRNSWRMHLVAPGETLADISRRYNTSTAGIVSANDLHAADAAAGDRLMIPVGLRPEPPAARTVAKSSVRKPAAHTASTGKKPAPHVSTKPAGKRQTATSTGSPKRTSTKAALTSIRTAPVTVARAASR
jgi:membrane-bound lytic murein transglycosylase D